MFWVSTTKRHIYFPITYIRSNPALHLTKPLCAWGGYYYV